MTGTTPNSVANARQVSLPAAMLSGRPATTPSREAGVDLSDEIADQLAALADAAGLGFAMRRLLDPDAVPPGFFETVSERWLGAFFRALAEDGGQSK